MRKLAAPPNNNVLEVQSKAKCRKDMVDSIRHNCKDQSHLSAATSATGKAFSAVAIAGGSQNQAIRSFQSLARTRESSMN